MSFASNLKQIMNDNEIKPVELAREIGKNKSSVSQYLSGVNIPKEDVQQKIASVLNCTVEDLNKENTDDLSIDSCSNVPIWKAAKLLNKSQEFIRISLQQGTAPFGFAAKKKTKWSYHISPKRLKDYIGKYEERNEEDAEKRI